MRILVAVAGLLLTTARAEARDCASNPNIPYAMTDAVLRLSEKWDDWQQTPYVGNLNLTGWPEVQRTLQTYCVRCHNSTNPAQPLAHWVDDFTNPAMVATNFPFITNDIDSGDMPPRGSPERAAWDALPAATRAQYRNDLYSFSFNSGGYITNAGSPWRLGIKNLFTLSTSGSACATCHEPGKTGYARFNGCFNCHTAQGSSGVGYPEWLRFESIDGMRRHSYYQPGVAKGKASLIRATDGTMPPGAAARDQTNVAASAAVSFCDEIITRYNNWLTGGMQ